MNCITYSDSSDISGAFRHSLRQNTSYKNGDIDLKRSKDNYQVGAYRDNPFQHYKNRLSEVYCYNRSDVKKLCCWTVTAPKDTPPEQEKDFFNAAYDFLTDRFCGGNSDNVCLAIVHRDEKRIDGKPRSHMHYYFMPIAPDPKHTQGEKICKKEVMPRSIFKTIHPDFQAYIEKHGISGTASSGITAKQARNYSIEEIKNGSRDRLEKQYQQKMEEKQRQGYSMEQDQEINFFTGKQENSQQDVENSWFTQDHEQEEIESEDESWF